MTAAIVLQGTATAISYEDIFGPAAAPSGAMVGQVAREFAGEQLGGAWNFTTTDQNQDKHVACIDGNGTMLVVSPGATSFDASSDTRKHVLAVATDGETGAAVLFAVEAPGQQNVSLSCEGIENTDEAVYFHELGSWNQSEAQEALSSCMQRDYANLLDTSRTFKAEDGTPAVCAQLTGDNEFFSAEDNEHDGDANGGSAGFLDMFHDLAGANLTAGSLIGELAMQELGASYGAWDLNSTDGGTHVACVDSNGTIVMLSGDVGSGGDWGPGWDGHDSNGSTGGNGSTWGWNVSVTTMIPLALRTDTVETGTHLVLFIESEGMDSELSCAGMVIGPDGSTVQFHALGLWDLADLAEAGQSCMGRAFDELTANTMTMSGHRNEAQEGVCDMIFTDAGDDDDLDGGNDDDAGLLDMFHDLAGANLTAGSLIGELAMQELGASYGAWDLNSTDGGTHVACVDSNGTIVMLSGDVGTGNGSDWGSGVSVTTMIPLALRTDTVETGTHLVLFIESDGTDSELSCVGMVIGPDGSTVQFHALGLWDLADLAEAGQSCMGRAFDELTANTMTMSGHRNEAQEGVCGPFFTDAGDDDDLDGGNDDDAGLLDMIHDLAGANLTAGSLIGELAMQELGASYGAWDLNSTDGGTHVACVDSNGTIVMLSGDVGTGNGSDWGSGVSVTTMIPLALRTDTVETGTHLVLFIESDGTDFELSCAGMVIGSDGSTVQFHALGLWDLADLAEAGQSCTGRAFDELTANTMTMSGHRNEAQEGVCGPFFTDAGDDDDLDGGNDDDAGLLDMIHDLAGANLTAGSLIGELAMQELGASQGAWDLNSTDGGTHVACVDSNGTIVMLSGDVGTGNGSDWGSGVSVTTMIPLALRTDTVETGTHLVLFIESDGTDFELSCAGMVIGSDGSTVQFHALGLWDLADLAEAGQSCMGRAFDELTANTMTMSGHRNEAQEGVCDMIFTDAGDDDDLDGGNDDDAGLLDMIHDLAGANLTAGSLIGELAMQELGASYGAWDLNSTDGGTHVACVDSNGTIVMLSGDVGTGNGSDWGSGVSVTTMIPLALRTDTVETGTHLVLFIESDGTDFELSCAGMVIGSDGSTVQFHALGLWDLADLAEAGQSCTGRAFDELTANTMTMSGHRNEAQEGVCGPFFTDAGDDDDLDGGNDDDAGLLDMIHDLAGANLTAGSLIGELAMQELGASQGAWDLNSTDGGTHVACVDSNGTIVMLSGDVGTGNGSDWGSGVSVTTMIPLALRTDTVETGTHLVLFIESDGTDFELSCAGMVIGSDGSTVQFHALGLWDLADLAEAGQSCTGRAFDELTANTMTMSGHRNEAQEGVCDMIFTNAGDDDDLDGVDDDAFAGGSSKYNWTSKMDVFDSYFPTGYDASLPDMEQSQACASSGTFYISSDGEVGESAFTAWEPLGSNKEHLLAIQMDYEDHDDDHSDGDDDDGKQGSSSGQPAAASFGCVLFRSDNLGGYGLYMPDVQYDDNVEAQIKCAAYAEKLLVGPFVSPDGGLVSNKAVNCTDIVSGSHDDDDDAGHDDDDDAGHDDDDAGLDELIHDLAGANLTAGSLIAELAMQQLGAALEGAWELNSTDGESYVVCVDSNGTIVMISGDVGSGGDWGPGWDGHDSNGSSWGSGSSTGSDSVLRRRLYQFSVSVTTMIPLALRTDTVETGTHLVLFIESDGTDFELSCAGMVIGSDGSTVQVHTLDSWGLDDVAEAGQSCMGRAFDELTANTMTMSGHRNEAQEGVCDMIFTDAGDDDDFDGVDDDAFAGGSSKYNWTSKMDVFDSYFPTGYDASLPDMEQSQACASSGTFYISSDGEVGESAFTAWEPLGSNKEHLLAIQMDYEDHDDDHSDGDDDDGKQGSSSGQPAAASFGCVLFRSDNLGGYGLYMPDVQYDDNVEAQIKCAAYAEKLLVGPFVSPDGGLVSNKAVNCTDIVSGSHDDDDDAGHDDDDDAGHDDDDAGLDELIHDLAGANLTAGSLIAELAMQQLGAALEGAWELNSTDGESYVVCVDSNGTIVMISGDVGSGGDWGPGWDGHDSNGSSWGSGSSTGSDSVLRRRLYQFSVSVTTMIPLALRTDTVETGTHLVLFIESDGTDFELSCAGMVIGSDGSTVQVHTLDSWGLDDVAEAGQSCMGRAFDELTANTMTMSGHRNEAQEGVCDMIFTDAGDDDDFDGVDDDAFAGGSSKYNWTSKMDVFDSYFPTGYDASLPDMEQSQACASSGTFYISSDGEVGESAFTAWEPLGSNKEHLLAIQMDYEDHDDDHSDGDDDDGKQGSSSGQPAAASFGCVLFRSDNLGGYGLYMPDVQYDDNVEAQIKCAAYAEKLLVGPFVSPDGGLVSNKAVNCTDIVSGSHDDDDDAGHDDDDDAGHDDDDAGLDELIHDLAGANLTAGSLIAELAMQQLGAALEGAWELNSTDGESYVVCVDSNGTIVMISGDVGSGGDWGPGWDGHDSNGSSWGSGSSTGSDSVLRRRLYQFSVSVTTMIPLALRTDTVETGTHLVLFIESDGTDFELSCAGMVIGSDGSTVQVHTLDSWGLDDVAEAGQSCMGRAFDELTANTMTMSGHRNEAQEGVCDMIFTDAGDDDDFDGVDDDAFAGGSSKYNWTSKMDVFDSYFPTGYDASLPDMEQSQACASSGTFYISSDGEVGESAFTAWEPLGSNKEHLLAIQMDYEDHDDDHSDGDDDDGKQGSSSGQPAAASFGCVLFRSDNLGGYGLYMPDVQYDDNVEAQIKCAAYAEKLLVGPFVSPDGGLVSNKAVNCTDIVSGSHDDDDDAGHDDDDAGHDDDDAGHDDDDAGHDDDDAGHDDDDAGHDDDDAGHDDDDDSHDDDDENDEDDFGDFEDGLGGDELVQKILENATVPDGAASGAAAGQVLGQFFGGSWELVYLYGGDPTTLCVEDIGTITSLSGTAASAGDDEGSSGQTRLLQGGGIAEILSVQTPVAASRSEDGSRAVVLLLVDMPHSGEVDGKGQPLVETPTLACTGIEVAAGGSIYLHPLAEHPLGRAQAAITGCMGTDLEAGLTETTRMMVANEIADGGICSAVLSDDTLLDDTSVDDFVEELDDDQTSSTSDPCVPNPCRNGATCSSGKGIDFTCECASDLFEGDLCQVAVIYGPCADEPCGNGVCFDTETSTAGYECFCDPGWLRDAAGSCTEYIPEEAEPTCFDGQLNGDETGLDCGFELEGECGLCAQGFGCLSAENCQGELVCSEARGMCSPAIKPKGAYVEVAALKIQGVTPTQFLDTLAEPYKAKLVERTGAIEAIINEVAEVSGTAATGRRVQAASASPAIEVDTSLRFDESVDVVAAQASVTAYVQSNSTRGGNGLLEDLQAAVPALASRLSVDSSAMEIQTAVQTEDVVVAQAAGTREDAEPVDDDEDGGSLAPLIGGIIGALVLLCICGGVYYWMCGSSGAKHQDARKMQQVNAGTGRDLTIKVQQGSTFADSNPMQARV